MAVMAGIDEFDFRCTPRLCMMRMHVIITGANGFIGKALTKRLLGDDPRRPAAPKLADHLTLLDLKFESPAAPRVRFVLGSIADPAVIAPVFGTAVDLALHLASIPGGMA